MVSFVYVSHSKKFAEGLLDLTRMSASNVNIALAGGLEDESYGTSFDMISNAIKEVYTEDGVIVLMDLGSAIMTTEMVLEDLKLKNVIMVDCPIVTGAITATVLAEAGSTIDEIVAQLKEI